MGPPRGSGLPVALAGALVVGVAYGMARYVYGLTLPSIRSEMELSGLVTGLMGGATFGGFLLALLAIGPLSRWRGPRAPTLLGAVLGAAGAVLVVAAPGVALLAVGVVAAGASAGLVWAPFSDLVKRTAPAQQAPLLLSVVTTGTAGGLVLLGLVAAVVPAPEWRLIWAATALLSAVSAVVDLVVVPRLAPPDDDGGGLTPPPGQLRADAARVRAPSVYAVVYLAAVVVYFTYATAAVRDRDLPESVGPYVYVAIGVTGCLGLLAGRGAQRWGVVGLGGWCLVGVGGGLAVLAFPAPGGVVPGTLALLASAALFGPGYMAGSALLAIWTSQVLPERPARGFVVALVAGSVGSVAAPPAAGALASATGLGVTLGATAVLTGAAGVLMLGRLAAPRRRQAESTPAPTSTSVAEPRSTR